MALSFDPIAEARRQWKQHDLGAVDAMAAATSITRAHQLILGRINDALKPFGLTFSRFEALTLLSFATDHALPLGKMGERLMVHPTSVTNTIDRLEADGLVQRLPHPEDRRTTLAQLTDVGRKVAREAGKALEEIEFGLAELKVAELRSIEADITALRERSNDFNT